MNFHSYKQHQLEDRWDAIVIGSGIGGLAAAALLSAEAGKKVLVLERHYTAGGYTHSFHRPGYQWDVGVHYIGEVHDPASQVRRVFDYMTDGQLAWARMPDVYDRMVFADRSYDFVAGLDHFRDHMKQYFPRDAAAIDRYIAAVLAAAKFSGAYFSEKAIPRPAARLAGGLMRRGFLRWASRTTAAVLASITDNRELIGVLAGQWGDYGLPPAQSSFGVHAIIAAHYFGGASYPIGGAARIVDTIAPLIQRHGGDIVVSADVAQVILEGNQAAGVRMADGRELRAPLVISDAGAHNTFARLIAQPNAAVAPVLEELRGIPPSMAHLSLYVGVKQTAAQLGLAGTNLWIHESYDHDANVARSAADPDAPFPVLFISFPSAKDPEFAQQHPGRATLEVVTMAPYDWFTHWEDTRWKHRAEDYDAFKQQLAARLQAALERHVPQVRGKIDYAELSTPLSTRHFMNYQHGEAYGLRATPARFRLRCLAPQTPIRNMYLTGQDVVSLGVTGALMGGVITASAVLGRNLVSKITKTAAKRAAAVA
ncbi:MAG: NAD(P)/FAD-dependent oxidoreductase [Candidatus Acidiferrales bacterium]